jgi:hypothetical protein
MAFSICAGSPHPFFPLFYLLIHVFLLTPNMYRRLYVPGIGLFLPPAHDRFPNFPSQNLILTSITLKFEISIASGFWLSTLCLKIMSQCPILFPNRVCRLQSTRSQGRFPAPKRVCGFTNHSRNPPEDRMIMTAHLMVVSNSD